MAERIPLQFAPFSSFVDVGFWHKLSDNKLNVYGLDDSVKPVVGFYSNGDQPGMPCRMNVEYTAFDGELKIPKNSFKSIGSLINTNTLDQFKECSKEQILSETGKKVWEAITSGQTLKEPSLLSRFLLLTYADLKKYHYYYWFAFPCLCPKEDFTLIQSPQKLADRYSAEQINQIREAYDKFQTSKNESGGYFLIVTTDSSIVVDSLDNTESHLNTGNKVMFGFADPCTLDQHPGWPLRNFLMCIAHNWGNRCEEIEVVCFRYISRSGASNISHSLILSVKLTAGSTEYSRCVGWEKNERQKLGPRMVNLSASMDPARLAESAVDLNLKLMRWRLLPELDLSIVANTKCLLLGAGTLGCNVARCLLGWGVRTITLVDYGKVSYSNPVRQTLFVFSDCHGSGGGKPKAEAAAAALKQIFPGVNTEGVSLSIPMPGHSISESMKEQTKCDVQKLDDLVSSHDAVFLLLDTRESRWLPTVMAASKQKIVICTALGFDTFLVMRHGLKTAGTSSPPPVLSHKMEIKGNQLGCYFCNDVVAPGDSTRDRTLDQQCTVSRPGMSYIASALAVELLVSVLQHPDRLGASADTSANDDHLTVDHASPLGIVPHQIRGFLSRFQQIMPACRAFDKCTACSRTVIEAYEQQGFDFLLKAFNDPHYLEDLTGLTDMHKNTVDAEVWDFDEDEEFSSMNTP